MQTQVFCGQMLSVLVNSSVVFGPRRTWFGSEIQLQTRFGSEFGRQQCMRGACMACLPWQMPVLLPVLQWPSCTGCVVYFESQSCQKPSKLPRPLHASWLLVATGWYLLRRKCRGQSTGVIERWQRSIAYFASTITQNNGRLRGSDSGQPDACPSRAKSLSTFFLHRQ